MSGDGMGNAYVHNLSSTHCLMFFLYCVISLLFIHMKIIVRDLA